MKKEIAIKELRKKGGRKITHERFSKQEWIKYNSDSSIITEDGYSHCIIKFMIENRDGEDWKSGWSFWSPNHTNSYE